MAQAGVNLEWLFETLEKRLKAPHFCKLQDLFLVIPYAGGEAEFEYEIPRIKTWKGNDCEKSYPTLYNLLGYSRKSSCIKVFFVSPDRLGNILLLNHKKYPYPKISQVKVFNSFN